MKKMVELVISLATVAAIGTGIAGVGADSGTLYKSINKTLDGIGVKDVHCEQIADDVSKYVVENEDGTVEIKDGLEGYLDNMFSQYFENPMDDLMSNFDF